MQVSFKSLLAVTVAVLALLTFWLDISAWNPEPQIGAVRYMGTSVCMTVTRELFLVGKQIMGNKTGLFPARFGDFKLDAYSPCVRRVWNIALDCL